MTGPTALPELNSVLGDLARRVSSALAENLLGIYLQGSFALGDWDLHSDVDFIIVVRSALAAEEVSRLQILHHELYMHASPWAQHLEGSYIPLAVLQDFSQAGAPLWYLDNGHDQLEESGHCNTLLVRWILREKRVAVLGPPLLPFLDPIEVSALRREMLGVLRGWGREILAEPQPYANRFYQGFIVLSFCRMLHDCSVGYPGSKKAGALWAKANLDSRWSGLIDRSWDTRPNPEFQVRTPAVPADFTATLDFVRYALAESDRYGSG